MIYRYLKSAYRTLLPARARTFLWTNSFTRGPREWLLRRTERLAGHEDLYSEDYFRNTVDPGAARSAPIMAASLYQVIAPQSAVDVGCGTGQLMMALARLGVAVRGLEYSEAALAICRERGLEVRRFDLEKPETLGWRADLVSSTEVAEHLPEALADPYVDLLCRIADVAFITAAVPGSTGTDHVNEQPNSYWIEKFRARGFHFDEALSHRWRTEWRDKGTEIWYSNSAMLFRRAR